MKKVIVVAPDFVPSNMPPSLRSRFMINHLNKFGWQPIIVSTDPQLYDWEVDEENYNLISSELRIIRTKALPSKLTKIFGFKDISIRSFYYQLKEISAICRVEKIDAILITVPPYYSMLLGRIIYKRFNIPYIIDYQDPWVTEYYWNLPRKQRPPKWTIAYYSSRLLERVSLRYVSQIIGVSKGTTDMVISNYSWLHDNITHEIPLGCEPNDFDYISKNPRKNVIFDTNDGNIHISYVGVCITAMYPAIRSFLKAIQVGLENNPDLFSHIKIHFIGTNYGGLSTKQIIPIANELKLDSYITEETNRVSYLDAIQILLDSDILAAFGTDEPHYTASKIFPYILSKKPIIPIFHEDSTVVEILSEIQSKDCITFKNLNELNKKTNEIYIKLSETLENIDSYNSNFNLKKFEKYSSISTSKKISEVLNKLSDT